MKVEVTCDECSGIGNSVYMEGNDRMYRNPETKTQSRSYHCPECKKEITVILIPLERD